MSKLRKTELSDLQQLLDHLNSIAIRTAEASSRHSARVLIEDSQLDEDIGNIYAKGVAEIRQAFRTLSEIEDKLEPIVKSSRAFRGIFQRAKA